MASFMNIPCRGRDTEPVCGDGLFVIFLFVCLILGFCLRFCLNSVWVIKHW